MSTSVMDRAIATRELNDLHYELGGIWPLVDEQTGMVNFEEAGHFVFAVSEKLRPKRAEIPGQLTLFDASEYASGGGG